MTLYAWKYLEAGKSCGAIGCALTGHAPQCPVVSQGINSGI